MCIVEVKGGNRRLDEEDVGTNSPGLRTWTSPCYFVVSLCKSCKKVEASSRPKKSASNYPGDYLW